MTRQITPAEPPKLDSFIQRFWAKVDKSAGLDACWLWTASTSGAGYGNIGMDGAMKSAREIRSRYSAGGISQKSLAAEYGIGQRHICGIILRQRWKHVK